MAAREMRRVLKQGGRVVASLCQSLEQHPLYRALFAAAAHHLGVPSSELATPFSYTDAAELRALLGGAGFRRVEIFPRRLDAHFPEPERFVQLTVLAGGS